ncbi:MAG: hypothetical protein PHH01_04730 [Patescibacteria group bacterium]|nr:hypothetical protein [Patescibacteria group bacterium]
MSQFDSAVAGGKLVKIESNPQAAAGELETSLGELARARRSFSSGNLDDVVEQAYFAMLHCARIALGLRGFRSNNVWALGVGLGHLFIDSVDEATAQLPAEHLQHLRDGKTIKDSVYGGTRAQHAEARNLLAWAHDFLRVMFSRLRLQGFEAERVPTQLPG